MAEQPLNVRAEDASVPLGELVARVALIVHTGRPCLLPRASRSIFLPGILTERWFRRRLAEIWERDRQMIYDLRRTRGIAVILITIAAVMLVYGVVLNAALRPYDGWLAEQRQDPGATTKFRLGSGMERIRGVVHSIDSAPLAEGERLGLLLGPSGLWDGVDPQQLTAELGGPHRWANIHSSGYAETYLFMTRLIYANGLQPDVLILVANPGVVVLGADRAEAQGWYDIRLPFGHLLNRQFNQVPEDLLGITYIPFRLAFPYHAQINTLYERSVFVAKLKAFEAWGSGLDSLFTPDPAPWQEPYIDAAGNAPDTNRIILTGQEKQGWFDASSYRSDGPGFKLITEVCRLAARASNQGLFSTAAGIINLPRKATAR